MINVTHLNTPHPIYSGNNCFKWSMSASINHDDKINTNKIQIAENLKSNFSSYYLKEKEAYFSGITKRENPSVIMASSSAESVGEAQASILNDVTKIIRDSKHPSMLTIAMDKTLH